MYRSIFIRELKNMNYKSTAVAALGLSVVLFIISLGQVFMVREAHSINAIELSALVEIINENIVYQMDFQYRLIAYALLIPCMLFFFYLGFPYLLTSYNTEKDTKNLFHLFITPLDIKNIILTIAIFSTFIVIVPSLIILLVNWVAFITMGISGAYNFKVLIATLLSLTLLIFSISYLVTTIFWVTNCNKIVYNICRVTLLFGMCSIYLLVGKSFDFPALLNVQTFILVALLSTIFIFISSLLTKFVSKEKAFVKD